MRVPARSGRQAQQDSTQTVQALLPRWGGLTCHLVEPVNTVRASLRSSSDPLKRTTPAARAASRNTASIFIRAPIVAQGSDKAELGQLGLVPYANLTTGYPSAVPHGWVGSCGPDQLLMFDLGVGYPFERRHVAGATLKAFLKARENAASES